MLESLFSTINHQLEDNLWGIKYPTLQNKLFNGELAYEDIANAKSELQEIQNEFQKLDLATSFLTSDNKNLFDVIFKAFDFALALRDKIIIEENSITSLPGNRTIAVLSKDVKSDAMRLMWGAYTPEFADTEKKVIVHVFNNNLEGEANVSRSIRFASGRIEWFNNNHSEEYRHEIAFDDRGQSIDDNARNSIIGGLGRYATVCFMSKEV